MKPIFNDKQAIIQWSAFVVMTAVGMSVAWAITAALSAFTPQDQPVGYVGQDEVTNFNLSSGNEYVFRSSYEREFWSGNLYVYPVSATGSVNISAEPWIGGAAGQLKLQSWDTGRYIATRNDASPSVGIPFRYASLSVSQQTLFPATTINTTSFTGQQIVDFLRGDRSNEGPAGMRMRSAESPGTGGPVLGDIVHSRPHYVSDSTNPTVFVGANDGMLHAFNATTGAERWAYVPSMLLSKMSKLAKPYGGPSNPHDYFVDGRINIGNASVGGVTKRILVGSLAAGGRGLYALNIDGSSGLTASSEAEVAAKALWEISGNTAEVNNQVPAVGNAYDNLGYTYGEPLIVKTNTSQDAVVIGNGYNNNPLGDYQAYLYVIEAGSGQLIAQIQAGSALGSSTSPNGILNVSAIDTNNDGKLDRVYGGDLKGNLWKFDLSAGSAGSWTSSILHTTSPAQPIVMTPGVAAHPDGGYMVAFGTGTMLDTADEGSTDIFYVYGIWDGAPVSNTTLQTQTLAERNYTHDGVTTRVRRSTANAMDYSSGGHKGWQVALPAGERIVGDGSFIESGRFYFTSHNPTVSNTVGDSTVTSLTVTNGGSGYTSATVSFSGGGGSGATATPVISASNVITGIKVTSSGTGYTSAPTVTINGNGTGATATANLSAGNIIDGENWLMELDYLSGGSKNQPFLDLDENILLNEGDRIKYVSGDTGIPVTCNLLDSAIAESSVCAIPGTDGIPVGKWLSNGVQSQPLLVQLATLNTTLFNQNPNAVFPVNEITYGVTGGHFDVDIFYNGTGSLCTTQTGVNVPASKAYATITVGTSGQTAYLPATLGGVQVEGVTIVPALTVSDIPDGAATDTNAATIVSKLTGGFTAARSGNIITIYAPTAGTFYNGKTFTILDGSSSPGLPGTPGTAAVPDTWPTGLVKFSGKTKDANPGAVLEATLSGPASVKVGSQIAKSTNITIGKKKTASNVVSAIVSAIGTGGAIKAYIGGNSVTPTCATQATDTLCLVDTSGTFDSNGQTVMIGNMTLPGTMTWTITDTTGGQFSTPAVPSTPATGWSNFKPALTVSPFIGGSDALTGVTITQSCSSKNGSTGAHVHQYDDKYDRTGVDFLNPSNTAFKLSNAVTSNTTQYKVLVMNQYLNPAVKIHVGDPAYEPSLDVGYISVKDYLTTPTLDLATLPTYTGTSKTTGVAGSMIGSLVVNMPTDALSAKDWWGNGDVRVGLHPINPGCGGRDGDTTDGNMYQPVIPPANGVDGPGINGWSASSVSLNSVGVRHNGALTVQIIKASTPNTAIEMNDPNGRPEYGWRVKSGDHAAYVLVEYTVYWHHPDNGCYGDAGWTKSPAPDNGSSTATTPAAGSTDPKLGDLSGTSGGTVTSVTVTVTGNVMTTTITYSTGGQAIITRTTNADGSVTILTRDADCVASGAGCTGISETIYNTEGTVLTGGDERGNQVRTGRVSWHELIRD
jgi:Tfp pilus tip-associated adhesin PilY1